MESLVKHPFTVLSDHKNLQYLREAKRLNPRQAHWALFTRFNYTISYRPGPKNTKADALSRLHTPEEAKWNQNPSSTKHSLSASYNGTPTLTPPPMLPRPLPRAVHRGTVCRTQRTPLIHPVHASLGTGHPGANNILSLLKKRYWWRNMARDVRRFIQGCTDCAISKSPRHLPAGKLLPLPVPNQPWSHLGVDFITDLPDSDGNTCILDN